MPDGCDNPARGAEASGNGANRVFLMKVRYKSSLQRTMIIYFILIGFAAAFVEAEFVMDANRIAVAAHAEVQQERVLLDHAGMQPDEAVRSIWKLRNKAMLMVAMILVVVVILLTMFIKNITRPLQHMIEVSKVIACGDLSRTVVIGTENELRELGDTVNDLTSNLQEMILLSEDMCVASGRFAKEVSGILDTMGHDGTRIENLRRSIDALNGKGRFLFNIIHNCKFYGIER